MLIRGTGQRESVMRGLLISIAVGVVLLLQTLGVFEDQWIRRVWPLIIIGLGLWLLYRRTHDTPWGGGQ